MKQIGSVIIFFILLFVFAKWGPAINFATTTQPVGEPFMVSGEGKVTVTPDIAKVTLGITESGSSLKTVQSTVNAKSKALTDALKKLGIADADIKTTDYSVYPQYDYSAPQQSITGYQVSTNYQVTVKNFDIVNDVIVAGTTAGANVVGSVSFELNDATKTAKTNEARVLAVKDAQSKAYGLAGAAGITLGKIINVSENQSPIMKPVLYDTSVSGAGGGSPTLTQPNIQPGSTDIDVTISLSYEVR